MSGSEMDDIDEQSNNRPPPPPPASNPNKVTIDAEHLHALQTLAAMAQTVVNQNAMLQKELLDLKARFDTHLVPPTPSASPTPPAHRSVKAKAPTPFTGEQRHELDAFLSQCRLCFLVSPESFVDEQRKVLYAGSYLEGIAQSWFEPLLQSYEKHRLEPLAVPCPPVFASFAAFTTAMMAMFGDPDLERSKTRELKALKQLTSVAVYASEFLRLKPYIGWNDNAFYDRFYEGLRDNVKDDLARLETRPDTLDSLIQKSLQLDIRIAERIMERKANVSRPVTPVAPRKPIPLPRPELYRAPPVVSTHPAAPQPPVVTSSIPQFPAFTADGTTPMILDSGRGFPQRSSGPRRLTPQERENRLTNNLCIFCGASGHYKSQCPQKALSDQRKAQYAAESAQRRLAMVSMSTFQVPSEPSVIDEMDRSSASENLSAQE
jgi:hypothetical protein